VATPAEALLKVPTPTLVVAGDRDSRSATAAALAGSLPKGRLILVPGDHVTALGAPEFTAAVLDFLGDPVSLGAQRAQVLQEGQDGSTGVAAPAAGT